MAIYINNAKKIGSTGGETKCTYPNPETLLSGNPARTSRPLFSERINLIRASEWTSEPGAWTFRRPLDTVEIFHVISGECVVTADGGVGVSFGPGEIGMLPAGFSGSFAVVKTVRKLALIVSSDDRYVEQIGLNEMVSSREL